MVCLTCAILGHTLRAWQTGVHLEKWDFKPEAVGGEPDRRTSYPLVPAWMLTLH